VLLGRERERGLDKWQRDVENLLLSVGEVYPSKLPGVPKEHRVYAIEQYYENYKDRLSIRFTKRDAKLELENRHLMNEFTRRWDEALTYLTSLEKTPFLEACSRILDCLHDLGIHRCEKKLTIFGRLHGFVIEIPSSSLNIPKRFPIVFAQTEEFSADELEHVIGLKSEMGIEEVFFIGLVLFNQRPGIEDNIQREGSTYGIEFCILDKELLLTFLASRNGEKDLIRLLAQKASLLRDCPYVLQGPAPDPVFFGREKEVSKILANVKQASVAIVGGRRIGKTSTLNKVNRALSKRNDIDSIYFDCFTIRDYEAFFDRLDMTLAERELPNSTRDPLKFRQVVSSLQHKTEIRHLVFLMDEVDALLEFDKTHNENLFGTFRSVSQEGKCSFVLCGAKTLFFSMKDSASGLFNFCDALRLRRLDVDSSAKLITAPTASMGVTIENEEMLVDRIISITSGHPNLIQFICRRMIELIDREHRRNITLDDFAVISRSAEFREFLAEVVWGDTTPLERMIMLSLIEGKGLNKVEILNALRQEGVLIDLKQLEQAIKGLTLYSIIAMTGNQYTFVTKAFPDVVKHDQDIDLLKWQYKKEWKDQSK